MANQKASIKYSDFKPTLINFGPVGRYKKGRTDPGSKQLIFLGTSTIYVMIIIYSLEATLTKLKKQGQRRATKQG